MFYVVFQDPHDIEIFNLYFRGICRDIQAPRNASYYHPKCMEPELLTFTQATLYIPLVYLSLLFLPTIVYVLFISCRKYGIKKMFQKFVDNTVFSIFAVVTNISFFKRSRDISKDIADDITYKNKQRSKSVPNLTNTKRTTYRRQISASLDSLSQIQTIIHEDHSFSRFQSNILFDLFFFGTTIFGTTIFFCMDLVDQTVRKGALSDMTLAFFGIFLLNIVLWIGINFQLQQKTNNITRIGKFEELMDVSSDILVCVLIAPLYWCSAKLRIKDCQRSLPENENVTENISIAMDGSNIRHESVQLEQIFRTPATSTLTVVEI